MIDNRFALHEASERLAAFRARIAVVFARLPMLSGFYVSDDLSLMEVTVDGWTGSTATSLLKDEICTALEDLIADDATEAAELLRGRTFARAVH